jgi:hypothetical protein
MPWFEILVLAGLGGVIGALIDVRKACNKISSRLSIFELTVSEVNRIKNIGECIFEIERLLFGLRYHVPFISSEDQHRIEMMETDKNFTSETLETIYGIDVKVDEIKELLKNIDENIKPK